MTGPRICLLIPPKAAIVFVTVTLVKVIFPMFVTVPVMVSICPGSMGCWGQLLLTKMAGEFVPGQVAEAIFVTLNPQMLVPRAVKVSV